MTQKEAVIHAFTALGGERTAKEIQYWVVANIGQKWKGFNTIMADMVSLANGGNASSPELKHIEF